MIGACCVTYQITKTPTRRTVRCCSPSVAKIAPYVCEKVSSEAATLTLVDQLKIGLDCPLQDGYALFLILKISNLAEISSQSGTISHQAGNRQACQANGTPSLSVLDEFTSREDSSKAFALHGLTYAQLGSIQILLAFIVFSWR